MSTFNVGSVIKVNGKNFEIVKVDACEYYTDLLGTLEGDASFLKGKRTIVAGHLKESRKGGYTYDWNAK